MKVVHGRADVADVTNFVDRLSAIGERHDAAVQAFDARYVAGRGHLEAAVERANRAIARDEAIADDRGIEILLYAAGRRQIDRALEMGVRAGESHVAIVVDGGDESGAAAAAADLLEPGDALETARDGVAIREFFGITDPEVRATDATLEALVIERVSLLAIDK